MKLLVSTLPCRLFSVWGPDGHSWRPERFLECVEHKTSIGVIANM